MKVWYVLLFIFPYLNQIFAQNHVGARLTGIGENGTAVNDVWSMQANPAGISHLIKPTVSIGYAKHLFSNEISTQALVAVVPMSNNYTGFSFQHYGFTAYNELKMGLAYAKKFGNAFTAALNINYHQLKITNYGLKNGLSIDGGILYCYSERLIFGAFVQNPYKQKFSNIDIEAPIPTTFNIGASYHLTDKVLIAAGIDKIVERATAIRMGIEYKIIEILSLRTAISTQPFKQYAGFGLKYEKLSFDMASSYDENIGYSPQISIGYAF